MPAHSPFHSLCKTPITDMATDRATDLPALPALNRSRNRAWRKSMVLIMVREVISMDRVDIIRSTITDTAATVRVSECA